MLFSRLQSYISLLTSDPLSFVLYMAYLAVTVLLSLILHEVAHGYVALRCGDPTAKWMGRLSLRPSHHLDPIGTVFMLIFGIGWAKPVPINPRNFRNGRRDDFLVSAAGICMNLTLMIVCTLLAVIINRFMWKDGFLASYKATYGSLNGLVNVFSEDGSGFASAIAYGYISTYDQLAVYAQYPALLYVQRFLLMMAQINCSLAVFNLLPIPPLDGYHLVNDTLMKGRLQLDPQMFRIAQLLLLVVCWTGILSNVLQFLCGGLTSAVANLFLMILGGA